MNWVRGTPQVWTLQPFFLTVRCPIWLVWLFLVPCSLPKLCIVRLVRTFGTLCSWRSVTRQCPFHYKNRKWDWNVSRSRRCYTKAHGYNIILVSLSPQWAFGSSKFRQCNRDPSLIRPLIDAICGGENLCIQRYLPLNKSCESTLVIE
jgi:hypothetical protein